MNVSLVLGAKWACRNNWCVLNAIKNNIEQFSIIPFPISISKTLAYELMK